MLLALVLAATLSTLVLVFWAGAAAGYVLGYAHRGLVGCRPWGRLWRWWAAVTWRLLIGPESAKPGPPTVR